MKYKAYWSIKQYNRHNRLLCEYFTKNTLSDKGALYILDSAFRQASQHPRFYLRLFNPGVITKKSELGNLAGEPLSGGYEAQAIDASPVGFPTLESSIPADETGTAAAVSGTTVQLDSNASIVPDFYLYSGFRFDSGPAVGQKRDIMAYNSVTQEIVVSEPWITPPNAGDQYTIIADTLLTSLEVVFSASTGPWGPVDTAVIATTPTGITGDIISYFGLSAPRTLALGDTLKFASNVKFN